MGNSSLPEEGRWTGDRLEHFVQVRVAGVLWRVVAPCLLVLGTLGNGLSLLVLTRKALRRSSVSLYLTFLAVADTVVLYTGLLRNYVIMTSNFDLRYNSEALCRLHVFAVYVSLDMSVWILVLVTVERVLCVWKPHVVKKWVTRKQAVARMACACALLMAVNAHYLVGMGDAVVTFGNSTFVNRCAGLWKEYEDFTQYTWPWIDLCIFFLVPAAIIITGNTSIIVKVIQSRRAVRKSSVPSISTSPFPGLNCLSANSRRTSSMTVTLLVINFVFLVTTSPVSVLQVGARSWLTGHLDLQEANYELAWAITNLIMYSNNTFNFLLYVISGPRFRRELGHMFRRS